MDVKLKFKLYRMSVWCGVVVVIANTLAFSVFGHLSPPVSPSDNAQQVADFLTEHRTGILWAVVTMGVFAPFFYPFAVITSLQMRRIEGGWGLLSMIQLTTAVVAPTGWVYPLAVLATAAYRPHRSPELMQLLSDQFWLTYVGVAVIFVINVAVIGLSALIDRRPEPVFPRWFGWLNLVLAAAFFPGVFVYVATDGPFAWDGLFTVLIPSIAFVVWKIAMIVVLLRAVKSEEREVLGQQTAVPAAA
ncbi:hypothetical protein OG568_04295 [Streptomyces sp. NBC_01450]|uniref:hypothetical protein n=1 Tax=Streptomyces sp. NBC_01450 TaxID=2903871 RepID=UPI002E349A9E|nr:hypothetical protein [Streptomyces sp. NBC_01450]